MDLKRLNLVVFTASVLMFKLIAGAEDNGLREAINFFAEESFPSSLLEEKFHLINYMNISLLKELNEIENKEDFAKFFGILSPRIRSSLGSALGATNAVNAGCSPLLTPVPLSIPSIPSDAYFPSCVLLERCGGCCYGDFLTCQPTQTETVNLKVMKITSVPSATDRRRRQAVDSELIVSEQRHLKCECQCAVMKKDCDPETQSYNANECSCQCSDRNSEAACLQRDNSHFWDVQKCGCFCRKAFECSSGERFDHIDCRCKKLLGGSSLRSVEFNGLNG